MQERRAKGGYKVQDGRCCRQDYGATPRMKINMQERFWSKVRPPVGIGECWEWIGAKNQGYGFFRVSPTRQSTAQRVAYEIIFDTIPNGLQLDHLCRNHGCVNPYHLEPVTPRENILRGETVPARNSKKTHCKNGHELTIDNLDRYALSTGRRMCRTCRNLYERMWEANKELLTC